MNLRDNPHDFHGQLGNGAYSIGNDSIRVALCIGLDRGMRWTRRSRGLNAHSNKRRDLISSADMKRAPALSFTRASICVQT
jgi:hypothetical protein